MALQSQKRPSLLSCTPEALSELLGGPGRARNTWKALQDGDVLRETLTPGALDRLERQVSLDLLEPIKRSVAECGTRKLLLPMARWSPD